MADLQARVPVERRSGGRLRQRLLVSTAVAMALAVGMVGTAAAMPTTLGPFTQAEIDTAWEADRTFPSAGATSVSAFGRDDVARLGIDSSAAHPTSVFHRTEGLKSVGTAGFGLSVEIDLYLDPAWATNATRAGFWAVGDDGAGGRDNLFAVLEFANIDAPYSSVGAFNGWRFWESGTGWTYTAHPFTLGEWVTLTITLDPTAEEYIYEVDGVEIGRVTGGENFLRELFLNSYNFGVDPNDGLTEDSYAAHWHGGLPDPQTKDDCKKGGWADYGFENQGQCIRFVNTGKDSR